MSIDPILFGRCSDHTAENYSQKSVSVWLNSEKGIPKSLEVRGKSEDGLINYDPNAFFINIQVRDKRPIDGAIIYMSSKDFINCGPCDNYEEAWKYFKEEEEGNQ